MIDKSLILNRLKRFKGFTTDRELADFLEISKSTLSNWYKRNSIDYDLLFSKCEQINIDWLITGHGVAERKTTSTENVVVNNDHKIDHNFKEKQKVQKKWSFTETATEILESFILPQKETISTQNKTIESLLNDKNKLERENTKLNQEKAQLREENERLRATVKDDKENTKENKEAV